MEGEGGRGPVRRLFRLGVGRPGPDEAVDWEVEHYLAEQAERLVEGGWSPADARREAERRFGRDRYLPRLRRMERRRTAMRKGTMGWELLRDATARASRTLRLQPGFAAAVVLTLGLGIGANAAMFGVLDRLLLSPPAHVDDHEAVRRIVVDRVTWSGATVSFPDFMDFRRHDGFAAVAAYAYPTSMTVGSGPEATQVKGLLVSHELLPLLGAEPVLGRTFTADEDRPGAQPTVVVSHEYWQRALGGGGDVLGRTLELSGISATIIGVAPPGFTGVDLAPIDAWLPIETVRYLQAGDTEWREGPYARGNMWLRTVARLRDPAASQAAEEQATALHLAAYAERVEAGRYPAEARVELTPLIAARGEDASDEAKVARWLGGVSLIVLLIACANVANLLLARGTRRRREVAVRLALGISRRRLVGQMMLESTLLGLLGGVVAVAMAHWGGALLRRSLLPGVLFPGSVLDGRFLLFTLTASVAAGLLAGVGPAMQSTRVGVSDDLREGGRGSSSTRSRLRSGLMVAQAAMSVLLLVGAGLFVSSLRQVRDLELGLDADAVVLATLETADKLPAEEENALYEEAIRRVASLPGVAGAAAVSSPFQWAWASSLRVPGMDSIPRMPGGGPYFYAVTPGYFEALGQDVVQGRALGASDVPEGDRVTVVNETMARALWPEEGAIGRCILVGEDAEACTTVVGVVEDASRGSLQTKAYMAYYLPVGQTDQGIQGMYVRAADGDGEALEAVVAPVLRSFSPRVRYATVQTLREILDPQARSWTLGASMFTLFGLLALLVAAVGLYSLLSFEVAQSRRELGVRSALGAARGHLLRSVLTQGLRLTLLGVILGLGVAWLAAPRAEGLLFQVSARDPMVLGVVAVLLLAVAAMAGLLPGLRATRIDPSEALRAD